MLMTMPISVKMIVSLCALSVLTSLGRAGEEFPAALHVIRKAGVHSVRVGDLLQIRYQTRAIATAIGNLEVSIDNDGVQKIAVVTMDIDPTKPGQPGAPYFIATILKTQKPGKTAIKITPITNEGQRLQAFEFTADVQAE
jgi:hypothetical protein